MKFASKKRLVQFLESTNQPFDPDDFDFTPYGRQESEPRPGKQLNYKTPAQSHVESSHQEEDQYIFPRIQVSAPEGSHEPNFQPHEGPQNTTSLQTMIPVHAFESSSHPVLLELPQSQVLNLSVNQTTAGTAAQPPVYFPESHLDSRARARELAATINAAIREEGGDDLAQGLLNHVVGGEGQPSTSGILVSSFAPYTQDHHQTFDSFSATYRATTSSQMPSFDFI